MELADDAARPTPVDRGRVVAAVLVAQALLPSCSSGSSTSAPPRAVADRMADTSAAAKEQRTPQLTWACPREARLRAFTDPFIYPSRLALRQVLAAGYPGKTDVLVQSNDGLLAFVLVLDDEEQIERRVRFERSTSVGWHVEVVLLCRQRSLR